MSTERPVDSPAYQLFMLLLCVASLIVLIAQMAFRGDPKLAPVAESADDVVCIVFLFDFVVSLVRARDRWRYFVTWGWLDLLSSLPAFDAGRWGRIARITRIARVLRALRASRILGKMLLRKRGQSVALAAALLAFFLVFGSSAAILHFEDLPDSNIKTADDAVWWAFATITTVGYGDKFPASGEGRIIAAILMTAGVGLFGAFSAALAAWFLAPEADAADEQMTELRAEIAALREVIERGVAASGRPPLRPSTFVGDSASREDESRA